MSYFISFKLVQPCSWHSVRLIEFWIGFFILAPNEAVSRKVTREIDFNKYKFNLYSGFVISKKVIVSNTFHIYFQIKYFDFNISSKWMNLIPNQNLIYLAASSLKDMYCDLKETYIIPVLNWSLISIIYNRLLI